MWSKIVQIFAVELPSGADIVNEASGAGITELPRGVATDTRSPESTHLMSNVSRGSLACSLIPPIKLAWALFLSFFHRIKSEGGPRIRVFELKWMSRQALLKV